MVVRSKRLYLRWERRSRRRSYTGQIEAIFSQVWVQQKYGVHGQLGMVNHVVCVLG
jgi:hypothetical protein